MKNYVQQGPYIALDFETSAPSGPCACAVGMARIENFEICDTFYTLIRPPSSRIYYSWVHGLYWRDLRDERPFAEVWPLMAEFARGARYFIAHNASFDRKVLQACCSANNIAMPKLPFLCTVRGARQGLNLKRNNLEVVCEHFGIALEHHHAGSDALACGLIHIRLRQLGVTDEQMRLGSKSISKKPTAASAGNAR